ncbi:M23 family metallopeptidase [Kytococcus sp. Marseille-QA3725]
MEIPTPCPRSGPVGAPSLAPRPPGTAPSRRTGRLARRTGQVGLAAALVLGLTAPTAEAVDTDPLPEVTTSRDEVHEMAVPENVQLPPPIWLPWQHGIQREAVSRHAPQAWSLADALGHGGGPREPRRSPTARLGLDPLDYKWPVWPVRIRRPFDPPRKRWGRGHRGVDLATAPMQPVFAAGPGVVTWSGTINSVGSLSVTHTPRLRTTYLPLTSRVPLGTPVVAGTPIGLVVPGHCLPACLHWGAKLSRHSYIDPTLLPEFEPELKPRDGRRSRR